MNLNFTKEQHKALRYVLHEMTMGRLGPSGDNNLDYDEMAINLTMDKMEDFYKDACVKSKDHGGMTQMKFRIRKGSYSIEHVNDTAPESDFVQVDAPKILIRGPIPDFIGNSPQEETVAQFPEEKYIHELLDNLDKKP